MICLKIIVGLGNPGIKYRFTRHNVGFMVIEHFANDLETKFKRVNSYDSMIAREKFDNQKIIILKPQTYMNLSGQAVKKITSYYKIANRDLLIVYDDLSLQLGQIRIRKKGSSGGHNGIESIIQYMGSKDIPRLKLGIGRKTFNPQIDHASYVLSRFEKSEMEKLKSIIMFSTEAIKTIIVDGFEKAMREYNTKNDLQ